jgi:hypothetical protein
MANITQAYIDSLIREAQVNIKTMFAKCTVVSVELKNGFVITESHSFASPLDYNEAMGVAICMEKIKNKLWELERYHILQEKYYALQSNLGGN